MRRTAALVLAGLMVAGAAGAGTPLPVHTGGRVAPSSAPNAGVAFQWPGTYFEARFKGDKLAIQFNDTANIYALYIDGKKAGTFTKSDYMKTELSKLGDGEHSVRLERLTETQGSVGRFVGFSVPDATSALPVPSRPRQIEFIGDSWTVGYGNTSTTRSCPGDQVWATTNTQEAFGALTAKHYDADYQINAYSGRGIVRNYDGFAGAPLPVLYPYALFDGKTPVDTTGWQPQIIVIGLGTNDFSTALHDNEKWKTRDDLHADYEATYVAFVQSIRANNPGAYFILMASDGANGEIQSEVQKVIDTLQKSGEHRIAFLGIKDLSLGGCDWHPNTADDQMISKSLIGYIDGHAELWQGK